MSAFLQQQLAYVLVGPACASHAHVLVHLTALPALAITGAAVHVAWRHWQGEEPGSRFFALVGWLMSGIALILILAQWLPALFLNPCLR